MPLDFGRLPINIQKYLAAFKVKLLVDRNAHRKNAPVILEEQEFFGEVYYYFSHQYNDHWSMLAYVQWVRNPQPSGHGPLKFRDLGAFES
ncbi:11900_t:CDS:2 [Funneliformis caledonium]|uniref:11900_t:CDS:1 n=1 Tax=Funneliformis caledonium TaxID=1117310 RepID=A0A9N9CAK9_9GLOM|nr:11900_t:CDS:2 [Funneliformis caledonium]